MNIEQMKKRQAEVGRKFFTAENIREWNLIFEDEPNECGIFITSSDKTYDWEPRDADGKTYCVKVFRLSDSSIDGILYNERNFGSLEDAKRMKENLTRALLESDKGFEKGILYTDQDMESLELMTFVSPDKKSVTLDLDELGRKKMDKKGYVLCISLRDECGGDTCYVLYDKDDIDRTEFVDDPEDATIFYEDSEIEEAQCNLEYNFGGQYCFFVQEVI